MIVIDISRWQTIDYGNGRFGRPDFQMWKDEGVDLVIAKATDYNAWGTGWVDYQYINYAEACAKVGLPMGAYMWDNPSFPASDQIAYFLKTVKPYNPPVVAVDAEQYSDKRTNQPYSKTALAIHTEVAYQTMRTLSKLPTLLYTRSSWIDGYCPDLWKRIDDANLWLALYNMSCLTGKERLNYQALRLIKKKLTIRTTWKDMIENRVPKLTFPESPKAGRFDLWQFTGDMFYLPGSATLLDVNYMPCSYAEWLASIGGTIVPEPEPTICKRQGCADRIL